MVQLQGLTKCARCGAADALPILYGLPNDTALRAAEDGIVVLGGCEASEGMATLRCRECGYEWGCSIGGDSWLPDFVAQEGVHALGPLSDLLEGAGWRRSTRLQRADTDATSTEIMFEKTGTGVRIEMWLSLETAEAPVWIHGGLDDPSEADRVYDLLASAGLATIPLK